MADLGAEREVITLYGTSPSLREISMIGFRAIGPDQVQEIVDEARSLGILDGIDTSVTGEKDPNSYDTAAVAFRPPAPRDTAEALGFMVATSHGVSMLDLFGADFDGGRVGARTITQVPVQPAA